MKKKELIDLITSFKKRPGEYTEDEIYQIGVAHKQLLQSEKCWSEVASLIGWKGSGEQLRSFINTRMRKEGTLPKNKRVLSNKNINEVNDEDLIVLKQELMVQQQKVRDEWSAYRRCLREDARLETLKDAIRDAVSLLNKLPSITYKYDRKPIKNREAILMFSDLHIGVLCKNFYNTYNIRNACEMIDILVDETIKFCKTFNVEKLNFVNLGDLIQGIIHVSARVEQEVDVVSQIMIAGEIVAKALNRLQEAVPILVYRSVTDNHSRVSPNKEESIESENLNRLIDWHLRERLKDTKIIFACDNLDVGIGKFTLNNGKTVVFAHGHNDNINQAFQHFVGATEQFVHYILLGHYHCEKAKSYQGAKVFVNGSIVGTEQYALSKRLFSKPSQTLLIFDDDNLINISIGLDLKNQEHSTKEGELNYGNNTYTY